MPTQQIGLFLSIVYVSAKKTKYQLRCRKINVPKFADSSMDAVSPYFKRSTQVVPKNNALNRGVHIGATWQIRWIHLCDSCDVTCSYYVFGDIRGPSQACRWSTYSIYSTLFTRGSSDAASGYQHCRNWLELQSPEADVHFTVPYTERG